jgi:hypothetical protein
MDENRKKTLMEAMQSTRKGVVGLLAMDLESTALRAPVSKLAVAMACEMFLEAAARDAKKNPRPEVGYTSEENRKVLDMVRDYIRNLSDEEFESFTSKETMDDMFQKATERLREMMGGQHTCEGCGQCKEESDEENPESLMN